MKTLLSALLLLTASSALAASSGTTVPLSVTTLNSCVFDTSNGTPTIDMSPDYLAGAVATGVQGQVSVALYCNKNTPISQRTLTGTGGTTTTAGTHIISQLTQFSPGTTDTLNAEVWFTVGSSAPVGSGTYAGAVRRVTLVNAGWPAAPQFGASTGFYTGSVSLTIVF